MLTSESQSYLKKFKVFAHDTATDAHTSKRVQATSMLL